MNFVLLKRLGLPFINGGVPRDLIRDVIEEMKSKMKDDSLKELPGKIGKTEDREILRLLNERGRLAIEVGRVKNRKGREVYDPSQEAKVFAQLTGNNNGPLPDPAVKNIFREIISSSRALQAPISVAYLGPEASFTHQAALAHFGQEASFFPKPAMADIFRDVERDINPWGVVPIENSLEGSVRQTQSQLISTSAGIRAEIFLRITLCLLASHQRAEKIKRIYSHPHALGQCREWLRKNLPDCRQIETGSTAEAARRVLEDRGERPWPAESPQPRMDFLSSTRGSKTILKTPPAS